MTAMLRSTLDAPAPASPLRPERRGRSVRVRLISVLAGVVGRRLRDQRPKGPDVGHAPAQDGPVDSVARRFATQRDGEATHRIWRAAAVGGGPGLR